MSYPGVDPTDAIQTNSVGTQERSVGSQEVDTLTAAADKAHEDALRGHNPPVTEDLNKAVERAVEDMFKVTNAWQPRTVVKFKVRCSSGQVALVKHLDTIDLIEHDLIEELDFFTRKLFPANIDASGNPVDEQGKVEQSIYAALRDPDKRCRFLNMTGKLMATASVDAKIIHDGVAVVPVVDEEGNETDEKTTKFGYQMSMDEQLKYFKKPVATLPDRAVYSGYIDFGDRMDFFNALNQPLELIQPFREEQAAMLQDLAREQGSGGEAE